MRVGIPQGKQVLTEKPHFSQYSHAHVSSSAGSVQNTLPLIAPLQWEQSSTEGRKLQHGMVPVKPVSPERLYMESVSPRKYLRLHHTTEGSPGHGEAMCAQGAGRVGGTQPPTPLPARMDLTFRSRHLELVNSPETSDGRSSTEELPLPHTKFSSNLHYFLNSDCFHTLIYFVFQTLSHFL